MNNLEHIETILTHLDYKNIRDRGKYYQASNPDGNNKTALSIKKSTLHYENYTRGHKGNIYTLVQYHKNCSFYSALKYIAKWIGIKDVDIKITKPFGGFYLSLLSNKEYDEIKTYSKDLFPIGKLPKLWFKDGVSFKIMEEFGISIDLETNRIIIPWKTIEGEYIGAKARLNENCDLSDRWSMYIPFAKSKALYGLYENYKYIQEKKKVIVVESEKAVLQLASKGCRCAVAIGGHSISKEQEKILKSLFCDEIIIAFDEDVCEDEVEFETRKLVSSDILTKLKILSYIPCYLLDKGSKNSPADYNIDKIKEFIKQRKILNTS